MSDAIEEEKEHSHPYRPLGWREDAPFGSSPGIPLARDR